jgi:serine/threonine protein kinase
MLINNNDDQNDDDHMEEDYEKDPNPSIRSLFAKYRDKEVRVLGDLLSSIFKNDPSERPNINAVLKHEWFKVGPLGLGARLHNLPEEKLRGKKAVKTASPTPKISEHDNTASGAGDSSCNQWRYTAERTETGEVGKAQGSNGTRRTKCGITGLLCKEQVVSFRSEDQPKIY